MNSSDQIHAENAATAARLVQVALQILSMRAIVLVQLALNTGAFAWALAGEHWMRLAGAAVFAIANWCVVHVKPPQPSQGADHGS
jgi:hypothetical protein